VGLYVYAAHRLSTKEKAGKYVLSRVKNIKLYDSWNGISKSMHK
jgi:hypothetical protein